MRTLKILFVLMAVMVSTGLKAADTLSVRDLTYQTVNIDTADITFNDSITANDAVLADYRENAYAKGYKLVVTEPVFVEMIAYSPYDTYSFLFNENFDNVASSDDYKSRHTGYCMELQAGVYYWVVTPYSRGTVNVALTISIEQLDAVSVKDLAYTPISFSTTIEDSLTENAPMLMDVRSGRKAQGYTFTVSCNDYDGASVILDTKHSWDSYLYLLDEHFNIIARNDDADNGSCITKLLNEGKYYIIVTQYDDDEFGSYSLTLNAIKLYDYNEITYAPIVPDTTLIDSIAADGDRVSLFGGYEIVSAKGYSVSLTQGDVLQMSLNARSNLVLIMMDTDYNVLTFTTLNNENAYNYYARQSGTHYVLLLSIESINYNLSVTLEKQLEKVVYYVDAVNGSNSNNGTAANDAFASLDYVMDSLVSPDYEVVCYLMSDVKLNKGTYSNDYVVLHLYPYEGRNITISSDTIISFISESSYMEIGNKDSGTITFSCKNDSSIRFMREFNGALVLNNVNINNMNAYYIVDAQGSNVVWNNCNIANNTVQNAVVGGNGSFTCNNSRIAYNKGEGIIVFEGGNMTMNNTQLVGNQSIFPSVLVEIADLYINNGVLDSNEGSLGEMYLLPDTMLTAENIGGVMSVMSSLHINGDVTMNNNYIVLVNDDVVDLGDNVTAENVGTILPVVIPDIMGRARTLKAREDIGLRFSYYEGKPVLAGNVYANYKRFNLYQPNADTTWYIISNGTLAKQEDVAVAEAAQAQVSIYPNPTSGMLYIHTQGSEATSVRLVDMQGRILSTQSVQGESVQLNMQSLAHGMYFVQIMNGEGIMATRKVVKK